MITHLFVEFIPDNTRDTSIRLVPSFCRFAFTVQCSLLDLLRVQAVGDGAAERHAGLVPPRHLRDPAEQRLLLLVLRGHAT